MDLWKTYITGRCNENIYKETKTEIFELMQEHMEECFDATFSPDSEAIIKMVRKN